METLLHLDFHAPGNLRIVSGLVRPFFGVLFAEMPLSWRFPPCPRRAKRALQRTLLVERRRKLRWKVSSLSRPIVPIATPIRPASSVAGRFGRVAGVKESKSSATPATTHSLSRDGCISGRSSADCTPADKRRRAHAGREKPLASVVP